MADEESFDAFYRGTRQRTFGCVYAMTGNPAEAQDVTHEAYARAWQRWSRVGGYANPEAWVRTVARRLVFSRWRRAQAAVRAYRQVGVAPSVPEPSPDSVAIAAALAALPASQRVTIALHYLADLTIAEVARELGVPEGTVKARLHRARAKLARHLADDPEEANRVRSAS
ncbi:RNA polymerase sigma-70 factor (ECF subfamily) [Catenuloplanes nepalensis]|uniref:RNA polymerase sigma-70 factor (ECF subfamily) n=1 Tax=Catenuloplanes nepalensis TaxID=587533 RepID=A0ABT9MVY8_9ACTN|nr:RNA polymerase sigma factor [Catenuloplanes nepalensis]MDP9795171.1 RNA polymerase sigma-70 factor (ECF subfamily) [Catenuloplanes nepalensis]